MTAEVLFPRFLVFIILFRLFSLTDQRLTGLFGIMRGGGRKCCFALGLTAMGNELELHSSECNLSGVLIRCNLVYFRPYRYSSTCGLISKGLTNRLSILPHQVHVRYSDGEQGRGCERFNGRKGKFCASGASCLERRRLF